MFYTPEYKGDDKTLFTTYTGQSIELSWEEMESLFQILKKMDGIDDDTKVKVEELEEKVFELEKEKETLQSEIDSYNSDEKFEELKEKILDLAEELK